MESAFVALKIINEVGFKYYKALRYFSNID